MEDKIRLVPQKSVTAKKAKGDNKLASYPSASLAQRKLGGILLPLPGKSGGVGKGSRDKINKLIVAYNKEKNVESKRLILTNIIDLVNLWSTKVSKEEYTFNREVKLKRQQEKLTMIDSLKQEVQLELNHLDPKPVIPLMSHERRVELVGEIRDILAHSGIGNSKLKFNSNHLSAENAFALHAFLQQNPKFLAAFKQHHALDGKLVRIGLDSKHAVDFGGGVYTDDNQIYMGEGEGHYKSFMRMFLHETGHASFQQMLYGEGEKDGVPLSNDGHILYEAWNILKENSANFLGLDLTDDPMYKARMPEGRRTYQQGAFNEFVAESFMHMALEEETLLRHANGIIDDDNLSLEVRGAWKDALMILGKYKEILLGN